MNPDCPTCRAQMAKVSSMQSGNARYETYRCPTCSEEKTACIGLDQQ